MRRIYRPLLLAFLTTLVITSPASSQDFAPDNVQAAVPWDGRIQIVNTRTGAVTVVSQSEDGMMAKWSPNGRYLVFMTRRDGTSMRLYDTRTGVTKVLGAGLTFPVAWREDSGRLAMFYVPPIGKTELIQYGVSERGINFRMEIKTPPIPSGTMVWVPATDNVAFVSNDGNVYTVEEGEVNRITTSADVIGLGLADAGKSLVWARRGPNPKYILTTIYSFDLSSRSVRRTGFPSRVSGINPDPRNAPVSIESAAFSPDGSRVALTLVFDRVTPPSKVATRQVSIWTVGIDGSTARQVVAAPRDSLFTPFWAPDSRALGLLRQRGATISAFLMAEGSGEAARAVLGSAR